MEVQFEHLVRSITGVYREIPIGRIPAETRWYFGCDTSAVYLTEFTAKKILQKHGKKVQLSELQSIPTALEKGLWVSDTKRGNTVCCSVWFNDAERDLRFIAGVKTTKANHRLLLTTFHPGQPKQVRNILKKGAILRAHT